MLELNKVWAWVEKKAIHLFARLKKDKKLLFNLNDIWEKINLDKVWAFHMVNLMWVVG